MDTRYHAEWFADLQEGLGIYQAKKAQSMKIVNTTKQDKVEFISFVFKRELLIGVSKMDFKQI